MKTAQELMMMLRESYELSRAWRENALQHKKYFDGDQLSEGVREILKSRGQPIQWENQYKRIGNKILGYKMSAKQTIKVAGRQRDDMGVAQLLTDLLTAIPDSTDYYAHKERADSDLMITGMSCMEVTMGEVKDTYDITNTPEKEIHGIHIPFEECYLDPYSKMPNYSDARYIQHVRWMDRDDLYTLFPKNLVDNLINNNNFTNDRNMMEWQYNLGMRDVSRDRVLISTTWCHEYDKEIGKKVTRWYIWGNNTILGSGDSPYKNEGFPYAVRKLFQRSDGYIYGIFEDIKPLQDSINFKHLRIANMLGSVKLLYEAGAVDDADLFIEEYSKDDAVVMIRDGGISKIKEIKHQAEINYLMQQIVDTRRTIYQIIGINDETLGNASNRMSGYAIEQRQSAGMVGLQRFLNTSAKLDEDFYTIAVNFIQQFFDAEQVFRIVDKFEADNYFTINEIERGTHGEIHYQDGEPKRKNKINLGRYDVTMKMVAQNRGAIGERMAQGTELMKTAAQINPALAQKFFPELLKDIESPAAEVMLKFVQQLEEQAQAQQMQQQLQQQQASLSLQTQQANLKEMESKSMMNAAKAQALLAKAQGGAV